MRQQDLFSPGELQRCLLCGGEYEPAVKSHACEIESDWTGCYKDSWKGLITPDAFAHPAKFSRSLIHRIYAHAKEEGWLVPGSTVIDPFGGVALGGLEAAWHGAHWVGVELEQRFVDLGRANIALWQTRFGHMSTWGSVQLVQGDSRQLSTVLERVGLCVSSPPYAETAVAKNSTGVDLEKQYATYRASGGGASFEKFCATQHKHSGGYGSGSGQLCNLPATDTGLRIAISSPPYDATGCAQQGTDKHPERMEGSEHHPARYDLVVGSPPFADVTQANDPKYQEKGKGHGARHNDYGTSDGQLGAMVVSSPPFAESLASDDPKKRGGLYKDPKRAKDKTLTATYGTSEGQLGAMKEHAGMVVSSPPYAESLDRSVNEKPSRLAGIKSNPVAYANEASNLGNGGDFWQAAREIVAQTYTVLAPNSHAIWVLKGFIRKKTYVDFPDQWRLLCEACGFITLHWHRCWLVEPGDVQGGLLNGNDKDYTRERKSFFRRLAERKGSPRIDFEVVLCTLKK